MLLESEVRVQVELSSEEQVAIEGLVQKGHFQSVDDAVHAAVRNLAEQHDDWVRYVRERVQAGEDDIAAGRVADGYEFLQRLRSRVQRSAA